MVKKIGEFNLKDTQLLKSRRGIEYIEDLTNGEIIAKRCNDCGEMKELIHFNNLKQKIAGKSNKCKICSREYLKKFHGENPDYRKKQYEKRKEKVSEYGKKRYEENKKIHLNKISPQQSV